MKTDSYVDVKNLSFSAKRASEWNFQKENKTFDRGSVFTIFLLEYERIVAFESCK